MSVRPVEWSKNALSASMPILLGGDDDDDDDDDSGGAVGLSHYDVTISAAESETFTLKVKGTSATPAFNSEDTGIATVSPDGVVKAVSREPQI